MEPNVPRRELSTKLKLCGEALSRWSSRKFKRFAKIIQAFAEQLKIHHDCEDQSNIGAIKGLQQQLNSLLNHESIKWQQWAKRHWYREGECNTHFFHACANQKRKKNCIKKYKWKETYLWKTNLKS